MTETPTASRAKEFREQLANRILVADGAMGTMLYGKGVFINRCFDELNLSSAQMVREIHEAYVKAGAEILETNTFGATRHRLAPFGLIEKLRDINLAGVRIAREAAKEQAFVAGAIGPLGVRLSPIGAVSLEDARAAFAEQAKVLFEAGVDLFVCETFYDIKEIEQAVRAIRDVAGDEIVIVASITIDDDGKMRGMDVETYTQALNAMPCDVVGINCSVGPKTTLETIERMMRHTNKPVSAMPNAGLPVRVEGRQIYMATPEYFSQYTRRFLWAGVKIVGGCCGTTPEHIKEIRSEVRSLQPGQRQLAVTVEEPQAKHKAMAAVPIAEKSQLGAKLAAGTFVSFVEILPPRGVDASKEIEGARLCKAAGIDCINVPDGPRASARLSAQVTCQKMQAEAGIETVLHFACRDRNILGIQSELLGAHSVGVRNLICITGDPPRMGTYPDATAVFDVDAIGLSNIVTNLNRGLDIGGNPMGSQTALVLGVGANPGAINMDEELRRFEWKVKAGAEYVVTQPVFDLDLLEAFMKKVEHLKIPFIAGIWPLTSYRNAEFMVNELRVPVPEHFMERMRQCDNADKARAEGVKIAQEMVQRCRPLVAGVQLSAPFGRYQMAIEVAEAIGPR